MGVTINSAVVPIVLSMFWERLTGPAMITGSVGGTVLALITWVGVTALHPGGLSNFYNNASECNICAFRIKQDCFQTLFLLSSGTVCKL